MNQSVPQQVAANIPEDDEVGLISYLDILFDNRRLIGGVALVITLLGTAYALIARPIYEANLLIQVEDSPSSSKNILGDVASMFEVKTAAAAEMEILRSRMVVSRAVDNLQLYTRVRPRYFPIVGAWLAGRNKKLSEPGLFGLGGWAWGAEQIDVAAFTVPDSLLDTDFVITTLENGQFALVADDGSVDVKGHVGQKLVTEIEGGGNVELLVERLSALPAAQFVLRRTSRLDTIEQLQKAMSIAEKGKQTGIIGVTLENSSPQLASRILNQIGQEYVRQNVQRKSEEAEKSLDFLNEQLPQLKNELQQAETNFSRFRNANATVDLSEEAKALLQRSVLAQTKLIELKQRRQELLVRFTADHPAVLGIDRQMKGIEAEMQNVVAQIKTLPLMEQGLLGLTRDVKVNTDLYTALLNSAQQLRLVQAGQVGNARLIDPAVVPEQSSRPNRPLLIAMALLIGLLLGVISAFLRKSLYGGISDAQEIEQMLGLSVYANIPYSERQEELSKQAFAKAPQLSVLALSAPNDSAIESLRSARTALAFSMLDAKNNVVLFTGPTPGIGKSFLSLNLAVVMAAAGKKVLLIDGDLRRGHLHQYIGIGRENGLTELVMGSCPPADAIRRGLIQSVDFIPSGSLPPNPSELLLHENVGKLLESLSPRYDYILIDTPPVLVAADALILAPQAGALFMVARAGFSTIGDIKEATKRCHQVDLPIRGVVFNGIKRRPGYGYGYGYKYGRYRYTQYKYSS